MPVGGYKAVSSAQGFGGGHIDPVVQKDLLEILCRLGIVDDQPRIAIVASTESRPILAADDHDLRIDDDALVVDMRLDAQMLDGVDGGVLQSLDPHMVLKFTGDQSDIHPGID